MNCTHCHMPVIPASCGWIHTDTHNTHSNLGGPHTAHVQEGHTMHETVAGDIGEKRKHVEIPAEVPIEDPATVPAAPAEPVPA